MEAARRSLVLLKNKDNFLPLDRKNVKTIAVIGPNANSRDALIGNYYGTSSRYITPLEGLQQYLGEDTRVLYAEGCHLYKDKVQGLAEEKDRFKEALIMAEQSDVVVMCLGLDATIEGEEGDAGNEYASGDKLGLMLPGLQEELLEAVAAVGKPVVLVLSAGSAIDLSWAEEHVDAIIDSWYPGARGGKAVAEAIFGEYSPSGKLPVTFYQGTENLPEFTDYSMAHRTYRYTNENVLYPFGYGLHYGETNYDGLSVDKAESDVKEPVEVFVNVTNDSRYTVNEIVQLYIRHVDAAEYEPGYQLKGIEVVKLEPHETKKVKLTLSPRDFAVIEEDGSCVAVPGIYEISAGGLFMRKSIWNAIERKLDDYSLRKKFYIFYVLCVMLPLIVTDAVVLSIVNNAEKESSRHEMSSIASAVGYNLSSMVNNAGEAAKSIYTSKRIDDFISKEYTSSAEYVSEYQSFFQDTLFENTLGMSNIVFFLYADNPTIVNGGKVNDMSAVRNTDSYRLLEQKGSGGLFFVYEKGGAGLSDERRMIYMQKLDFYSSDI